MKRLDYRNITRYDDGSINFEFYRRRSSKLRSDFTWDILSHMRQHLPFISKTKDTSAKVATTHTKMSYCR